MLFGAMKGGNDTMNKFYMHFKGYLNNSTPDANYIYSVKCVAKDCDTLEPYVVYNNVISGQTWIRKLKEFESDIDRDKYPADLYNIPDNITKRFTPLTKEEVTDLFKQNGYLALGFDHY